MKRKKCDFCDGSITIFLKGYESNGHTYCSKNCLRLSSIFHKNNNSLKAIHSSYSNLGAWKVFQDNEILSVRFNQKQIIWGSVIIALLCFIGGSVFYYLTRHDDFGVLGLIIGFGVGILVPFLFLANASSEKQKGDLLKYDLERDLLELRGGIIIENAKDRVVFSYEHYDGSNGDYDSELNKVVDGNRSGFIHHIGSRGSCENIALSLADVGFRVEYTKQDLTNR